MLIIAALLIGVSASAHSANQGDKPSFEVSINIDTLVAPDIFYLSIQLEDKSGIGKKGVDNIETKVLIPTLKQEGVDTKKQLSIENIYSSYTDKGKDVMSKFYTLTLYDTNDVKNIISKLRDKEIVVSLQRTDVKNRSKIEQELRIKALKRAQIEADSVLVSVGYKAGELMKVFTNIYETGRSYDMTPMMKGRSLGSSNESVDSFRKESVSVSVVVVYSIEKLK